jgi:hypothetical protein
MAESIAELRREFEFLVSDASGFFELVDRRRVGNVDAKSRPYIPDEQLAWQDDIRRRLCCLLVSLATLFQESPLLNGQDSQRLTLLGRAMDAALGLKSYHRFGLKDSGDARRASEIFKEACEEMRGLLHFIPGFLEPRASTTSTESAVLNPLRAAAERAVAELAATEEEERRREMEIMREADRRRAEDQMTISQARRKHI